MTDMESFTCRRRSSDADQSARSCSATVKCEPAMVKEEPECGVSEAAAAENLHTCFEVKDEIVFEPELIQQQDIVFSIQNGLTRIMEDPCKSEGTYTLGIGSDCERSPVRRHRLRSCYVRLERLDLDRSHAFHIRNYMLSRAEQDACKLKPAGEAAPATESTRAQSDLTTRRHKHTTKAAKTPLGALADQMACPPQDRKAFKAIVFAVENNFPSDWRSWEVLDYSYQDLFEEQILSSIDNKVRFAVPTIDLARAFFPPGTCLSQKKYQSIKLRLLQWDFGRALVYAPLSIMKMIHESSHGCFKLLDVVHSMKSKLTTRHVASKELQSSPADSSPASPSIVKRKMPENPREEINNAPPQKKHARKGATLNLVESILNQQLELINKFMDNQQEQNENINKILSMASRKEPKHPSLISSRSIPDSTSKEAKAPAPLVCPRSFRKSKLKQEIWEARRKLAALIAKRDIDFDSNTRISKKPEITQAEPFYVQQGIECQRLGKAGWRNMEFNEIKKQFEASPAFCALRVNSVLPTVGPQSKSVEVLERCDLTLGAITHGLLQQKQIFNEFCNGLPPTSPCLQGVTIFQNKSDDLLQYVCGRRAQVIEARRNRLKSKNKNLSDRLRDIPPSEYHLFSDSALRQALKDN